MNDWLKQKLDKGVYVKVTIPWPEGPAGDKRGGDMGLFSWFPGVFNKFVKVFKAFLAEALPIAKQIIIATLKDIAIAAVTKAQNTDLKNEDKRTQAFKEIKDYAVSKGIEAGDSLINLSLELALQKIKG